MKWVLAMKKETILTKMNNLEEAKELELSSFWPKFVTSYFTKEDHTSYIK